MMTKPRHYSILRFCSSLTFGLFLLFPALRKLEHRLLDKDVYSSDDQALIFAPVVVEPGATGRKQRIKIFNPAKVPCDVQFAIKPVSATEEEGKDKEDDKEKDKEKDKASPKKGEAKKGKGEEKKADEKKDGKKEEKKAEKEKKEEKKADKKTEGKTDKKKAAALASEKEKKEQALAQAFTVDPPVFRIPSREARFVTVTFNPQQVMKCMAQVGGLLCRRETSSDRRGIRRSWKRRRHVSYVMLVCSTLVARLPFIGYCTKDFLCRRVSSSAVLRVSMIAYVSFLFNVHICGQGGHDSACISYVATHTFCSLLSSLPPPLYQFEALVDKGADPKTNKLCFQLRGEGTVPRLTVVQPSARTDDGQPLIQFPRLFCGKSRSLSVVLRNDGMMLHLA